MQKQNKAITLIALIITIIVLLILAAVTINMVLGENGLFNKAKISVAKYENAQEKENVEIAKHENEINSYINGNRDYEAEIAELKSQIAALKTQNTMSGTEHFIGKYYINGKPIYEKTLYISTLPSNNTKTWYNHNITDVDEIWFDYVTSFIKWPTGEKVGINYPDSFSSNGVNAILVYDLNKTKLAIVTGTDRSNLCAYITLQYTKTTDTATITPNITTITQNI